MHLIHSADVKSKLNRAYFVLRSENLCLLLCRLLYSKLLKHFRSFKYNKCVVIAEHCWDAVLRINTCSPLLNLRRLKAVASLCAATYFTSV